MAARKLKSSLHALWESQTFLLRLLQYDKCVPLGANGSWFRLHGQHATFWRLHCEVVRCTYEWVSTIKNHRLHFQMTASWLFKGVDSTHQADRHQVLHNHTHTHTCCTTSSFCLHNVVSFISTTIGPVQGTCATQLYQPIHIDSMLLLQNKLQCIAMYCGYRGMLALLQAPPLIQQVRDLSTVKNWKS